jgi:hypothetical protein
MISHSAILVSGTEEDETCWLNAELAGAKAQPVFWLAYFFGPAEAVPLLQGKILRYTAVLQSEALIYAACLPNKALSHTKVHARVRAVRHMRDENEY